MKLKVETKEKENKNFFISLQQLVHLDRASATSRRIWAERKRAKETKKIIRKTFPLITNKIWIIFTLFVLEIKFAWLEMMLKKKKNSLFLSLFLCVFFFWRHRQTAKDKPNKAKLSSANNECIASISSNHKMIETERGRARNKKKRV